MATLSTAAPLESGSVAADSRSVVQLETNPRGIPKAGFFESVEEYIGGDEEDADAPLKALQETLAKYRFMETNSLQRRAAMEEKVPELERTIKMVEMLQEKKEAGEALETTFELSDTLYAKGIVEEIDEVYIWLGAGTMLSYPLIEAHALLTSKLVAASLSLKNLKEDQEWLRDQITVTEVNVARVYNWDVKRRRDRREKLEREERGKGAE